MTVSTFFPDADVETSSVDGRAGRTEVNEIWATIRAGAGNLSRDDAGTDDITVQADTITDQWVAITRGIFVFDTNTLPDGDEKNSATMGLVINTVNNGFTSSWSLVLSTPASETAIVDADYAQVGSVKQAADVTLASLTADGATVNNFVLNATGLGNISLTARSLFGVRHTPDVDNSEPTWSSGVRAEVNVSFAEEVSAGDDRPRLAVTHTVPTFVPKVMVF